MNRIVLIGNGFDLAHGLKTSYADFIDWYWREWGKYLLQSGGVLLDDGICSFRLKDTVDLVNCYDVWNYHYKKEKPFQPWDELEALNIAMQDKDSCDFSIKSPLFEKICEEINKPWCSIEEIYYAFLKSSEDPKQVNDDLEFLKDKLINYLNHLEKPSINPVIKKQILSPINKEEIAISSMNKWDNVSVPDNLMMLDFNYTDTTDKYLPKRDNCSVNHIHGRLSNPDSVIFGYGDERDDEYKNLTEKKGNEYLRHIKSFHYLDASNYRRMLVFIESAPYQLCIMGHSCGISDRTLLSTLFEHDNCVSIKPYYYRRNDGTDNYRELVQNIARNFSDPRKMRDRVVGKERCEALGKE